MLIQDDKRQYNKLKGEAMEVKLAEYAGFCFGVKRAIDTVYEEVNKGGVIYTYGPIVHNEEVVKDLADKGVYSLDTEEELEDLAFSNYANVTVVIRAHGVPERIYSILESVGATIVDATCPFVKRIHNIVREKSLEGYHIIIVGSAAHPEVEGIVGWCKGKVTVVENAEEAAAFEAPLGEKIFIVSQTTFNYNKFEYIVALFKNKGYNVNVVNTICSATEERQRSAQKLAAEVDAMIVIGGKHSSNTAKLYEICSKECALTYYIQTLDDLRLEELPKAVRLVGVTAGASTPNKLIEEVQNYVRINF